VYRVPLLELQLLLTLIHASLTQLQVPLGCALVVLAAMRALLQKVAGSLR